MKDTWRESWEQSERNHRELQKRIIAIPGSERVLSKLTREGANREKLLSLLANSAADLDFWRPAVRRKKRELESIANQLQTVANHAQRASLDPLCYGTLWLAMLGLAGHEVVKSPKEVAPLWVFGLMRLYAENCRQRAKAFGNLLREHPPRQKRAMIDCLLLEIWRKTGKYHDKEIAFLLTNASEAAGHNRVFTDDQIKKQRQRYVVPRIKKYLRLHPAIPDPDWLTGDTSSPPDSFEPVP
jgi:hypothetical protein